MKTTFRLAPLCGVLLSTLLFYAASGAQQEGELVERVLARVDDRVITLSELTLHREFIGIFQGQKEAPHPLGDELNQYIEETLILRQAAKFQIAQVSEEEVLQNYNIFEEHFASPSQMQAWMNERSIAASDVKVWIRDRILLQKFIHRRVTLLIHVTDTEINKYYKEHVDEFPGMSEEAANAKIKDILYQESYDARYRKWLWELKQRADIRIIK